MPWALVVAAVLSQAQSPTVQAARKAMDDLKYPEARALLQKARQQPDLQRDALVEILWLQGLVAASMNQTDGARAAFRALFAIEPDHRPEQDYPPKIMSPYYEARGWIATTRPLGFARLPPVLEGGRVKRIAVKVQADPLSLASSVRFHLTGGETKVVPLEKLAAALDVDAESVSWWAELMGERNAQLAVVGSEKQPLTDTAVAPVAERAPVETAPPSAVSASKPMSPLRTGGIAAAGVAVASFGLGLVFGIRSKTMAGALRGRTYDENGAVAGGWTQAEAVGLELQQRREAGVANAMFVTAGLLLVAAVVLFIVGAAP